MGEINLTQAEADALLQMEKHTVHSDQYSFPTGGESLILSLQSSDRREAFLLDLSRGRINLEKVKVQNRARQVVVLARLDLAGPPHRNPDGEEFSCPHLHVYREGYGDKWAFALPIAQFTDPNDIWTTYQEFLQYCNITQPPNVDRGLFV